MTYPVRKIALINKMGIKRKRDFIEALTEANLESENNILKEWITRNYGKRCPDYAKDCGCCKAWKCFDYLVMEE